MTNTELAKRLERCTTVEALRDILDEQIRLGNGELPVVFSYNYGDHWSTPVAEPIAEYPEEVIVTYSDYHNKMKIQVNGDEEDDLENQKEGMVKVFNLTGGRL